ncbi:hypothetical protein AB0O64_37745 [Streptomyces sp. NPDC088341]|uniref:hypothetical protein n=1 Tax=Streptomyces sp. NPDC088341 TaxID=3154870 RepID=UPI00342CE036
MLDALGQGNFACYGSSGSPIIEPRPANCRIARPNGSSVGIDALRGDIDTKAGCLDFAGGTRGPLDTSTQDLSWIQFGTEGVTAAVRGDSRHLVHVVVETARLVNTDINAAFVGASSRLRCNPAVTAFHGFGALSNYGTVAAPGER